MTKLLPKGIEMRPIAEKTVREARGADYVVAVPNKFTGPVVRKLPQPGLRDEPFVRLNSYSSAYKWDGKPEFQTAMGWGH